MIPTDAARAALTDLDATIAAATDLDTADTAYFAARSLFYGLPETVAADDGVRFAWSGVIASFGVKLDEFATPIVPLVVLR